MSPSIPRDSSITPSLSNPFHGAFSYPFQTIDLILKKKVTIQQLFIKMAKSPFLPLKQGHTESLQKKSDNYKQIPQNMIERFLLQRQEIYPRR
jgi:hypothetical protein